MGKYTFLSLLIKKKYIQTNCIYSLNVFLNIVYNVNLCVAFTSSCGNTLHMNISGFEVTLKKDRSIQHIRRQSSTPCTHNLKVKEIGVQHVWVSQQTRFGTVSKNTHMYIYILHCDFHLVCIHLRRIRDENIHILQMCTVS